MATLHIASKADKAKAGEIEAMIDNGELPHPPALDGKANTCAKCGKTTLLARFYIPGVGWSCEKCFDDWRTTPVWCSTRADVHIGCVHIIPQCVIDADDKYKAQVDDLILKALDRVEKQRAERVCFSANTPQTHKTAPISSDTDGAWVFDRVAQIRELRGRESTESEARWHAARNASLARRGDVTPGRYQRPIVKEAA